MKIKILDYIHEYDEGFKLGYLDVLVENTEGNFLISGVVHLKKGDNIWFALPSKKSKKGQFVPSWQYENPQQNKVLLETIKEEYKNYSVPSIEELPF